MATISERIIEGLRIKDLKQTDLVKLTGIGKSSISTYITGSYEPKQKNIYKIAKALGVSESWLMGYDVPMERNAPEDANIQRFDDNLENALRIIESAGYFWECSNSSNSDLIIRDASRQTEIHMFDYELVNRYESLQKKGHVTAEKLLSNSKQIFLQYIYSLGYSIHEDDPEHAPFMQSKDISLCKLHYNTIDLLKFRIDAYAKATIDSELLSLKEDEIRKERLEREQLLQILSKEKTSKTESRLSDCRDETSCTIIPTNHFTDPESAREYLKSHKLLAAWDTDNPNESDIISMANAIWTEGN